MRASFYFRAWWPQWLASVIFSTAPLYVLTPEFTQLALMLALGFAVIGWFAMGLVMVGFTD